MSVESNRLLVLRVQGDGIGIANQPTDRIRAKLGLSDGTALAHCTRSWMLENFRAL